jgi:hypothetical protein
VAATTEGNALSPAERHRVCGGKRKYDREGRAIAAVIQLRQSRRIGPLQGRVYRCPVCTKYHVTTAPLAAAPMSVMATG